MTIKLAALALLCLTAGTAVAQEPKVTPSRGPRPHMMTKELTQKAGQPADPDPSVASIARSDSAIRDFGGVVGVQPGCTSCWIQ